MEGARVVVLGVVLGIVGTLPSAFLFERALRKEGDASVAAGLASVMASFVVLSAAIAVVWFVARDSVLSFGVALAASFLLVWAIEAGRAWHRAQHDVGPGERNMR